MKLEYLMKSFSHHVMKTVGDKDRSRNYKVQMITMMEVLVLNTENEY
jgi:hypothetical protein